MSERLRGPASRAFPPPRPPGDLAEAPEGVVAHAALLAPIGHHPPPQHPADASRTGGPSRSRPPTPPARAFVKPHPENKKNLLALRPLPTIARVVSPRSVERWGTGTVSRSRLASGPHSLCRLFPPFLPYQLSASYPSPPRSLSRPPALPPPCPPFPPPSLCHSICACVYVDLLNSPYLSIPPSSVPRQNEMCAERLFVLSTHQKKIFRFFTSWHGRPFTPTQE